MILALAILAGSLAVLGELVRISARCAVEARDLTRAQLLCESKLAEITSAIVPPQPAERVPLETDPRWVYSIELAPVDQPGLLALRVTVQQNLQIARRPLAFSLVRWIADPGIELPEEPAEQDTPAQSAPSPDGTSGVGDE